MGIIDPARMGNEYQAMHPEYPPMGTQLPKQHRLRKLMKLVTRSREKKNS